jgi:ribosomal protein S18 acetylase RimI-like enzyme
MRFALERLSAEHPIASFSCGTPPGAAEIDEYLKVQALPEQNAGLATVWVAIDRRTRSTDAVIGYFSISPTTLRLTSAVQDLMPLKVSYAQIGGYLLGRLGVAEHYQGSDWGSTLVAAAIAKSLQLRETGGGAFLAVDPKNDRLASWYDALSFGFVPLDTTGKSRRRILKLASTIAENPSV